MKQIFLLFLSLIGLFGCATTYHTGYESYLLNSNPKSLQVKDDKFEFSFKPVPNGIYFTIKNLGTKPGFLEWDRCYFIEPDGNSSKAFNPDLLEENSETMVKAKYESILPPNGLFMRFTSSAKNIIKFRNITKLTTYFYSTNTTITNSDVEDFYNAGRYWPEYKPASDSLPDSAQIHGLDSISNYVMNNNNMGLGLGIKLNDTVLDYKFDFRIKKVTVYKETKDNNDQVKLEAIKSTSESNGWAWKSELPPSESKPVKASDTSTSPSTNFFNEPKQ